MNSTEINISVLVPVYNVEKYLKACLESVIQQSKQVYEVILVDDGSTDSSGAICDEYSQKYEFIKSYHKENQGLLSTRRYAIDKATGNWYVFLDSDDTLKQYAIQKIFDAIQLYNPDCIIYGLDRVREGETVKHFIPEVKEDTIITDKSSLYELVFTHSTLNPLCRKAIRSSISIDDYSTYYRISHSEDLLQSIEIYEKGERFIFLIESLYNYTVNPNSMTNTINIHNYRVDFTVREMVASFLQRENVFSEDQWDTYNQYALNAFINQIKTVLTFRAHSSDLKKILKKMRNTCYYKKFISIIKNRSNRALDKWIYYEFFHEHDNILLILNSLYRVKRRIKQCTS